MKAKRSRGRSAWLAGAALLAAACGSGGGTTSGTSGTTGTGGGNPGREPKLHRPMSELCDDARPAGSVFDPTGGACASDNECSAGDNGRCVQNFSGKTFCSYDECSLDADCGSAGVCGCRNPASFSANVCFHGSCRLDADCGAGGYCSPSAVEIGSSCNMGISPGSVGYFCHTAMDQCVDDADCSTTPEGVCLFSVDQMRWSCFGLMCTL
jgi:hypothetical protein